MSLTPRSLFTGPLRYLPSLIVMGLLAWLTLSPDPMTPPDFALWQGADKLAHALMFGGLTAMLLTDAFRGRRINPLVFILIVIIGAVAGAGIELLQRHMGLGRQADRNDFIADAIGVMAASAAWLMGRLSR